MEPLLPIVIFAFGCVYSYLLYPLVLLMLPDRRVSAAQSAPAGVAAASIIVAAHNEEKVIAGKLRDTVQLRRACPELEILVASDASSDKTDAIVGEFAADNVVLVRSPERNGKEFAQGLAVRAARGDILIFTDVGTTIEAGSIERLLELFRDPSIAAVSSEDQLVSESGQVQGEGLYVRYEMWLRRLESRKGGLIGLSGSFFATRRAVAENWDNDIPSDFCVAINARRLGFRSVSDSRVVGLYKDVERSQDEFSRKARTVIRGMAALARKSDMLNPFRHGLFAFQLFSHKLMRWAVPWFALAYMGYAAWLGMRDPQLLFLSLPVIVVAAVAVAGGISLRARKNRWISTVYYFVLANAGIAKAAIMFLAGRRVTTWSPSRR